MPEQNKPFVINDRRKFTSEGELRPDAHIEEGESEREPVHEAEQPAAAASTSRPEPLEFKPKTEAKSEPEPQAATPTQDPNLPPPPTDEEMQRANDAYQQTSERLETAVRAANPGMEHPPAMSFEQIVHSIYMTTIIQLGGVTREGEQPRVDLMGARQSIDMLSILQEKTKGNLTPEESRLLDNALFELRMGFLEITQALARSAAARANTPGAPGAPGMPGVPGAGPKIVR
jgi:hypothetical protein